MVHHEVRMKGFALATALAIVTLETVVALEVFRLWEAGAFGK